MAFLQAPVSLTRRAGARPPTYTYKQPPGFSQTWAALLIKYYAFFDFLSLSRSCQIRRRSMAARVASVPRSSGSSCQGRRAADGGTKVVVLGGGQRFFSRRAAARIVSSARSTSAFSRPPAWLWPATASVRPESCRRSWRRCPARVVSLSLVKRSSGAQLVNFSAGTCSGPMAAAVEAATSTTKKPTAHVHDQHDVERHRAGAAG